MENWVAQIKTGMRICNVILTTWFLILFWIEILIFLYRKLKFGRIWSLMLITIYWYIHYFHCSLYIGFPNCLLQLMSHVMRASMLFYIVCFVGRPNSEINMGSRMGINIFFATCIKLWFRGFILVDFNLF